MKTIFLLFAIFIAIGIKAQDTVHVSVLGKNMVTVVESGKKTDVKIGDSTVGVHNNSRDTVKIRVGRKTVVISEGHRGSSI